MSIVKTVYIGRDNPFTLTFSSTVNGVTTPLDFAAIYSMKMELFGSGIAEAEYTLAQLVDGNPVDVALGAGVVRFRLGLIGGLTAGTFELRLAFKTSINDTPTQLSHERGEIVLIEVVPFTTTLVVEDGTGLANAVCYMSVAEADAYHAARRNLAWSAVSKTEREAALVRASDYIDQRWGRRFHGFRLTNTQSLEWPRSYAFDEFGSAYLGIPTLLKNACAEYALRATAAPLAPDPVLSANGKVVRTLSRVEGAVTEEIEYAPGYSAPEIRPYPAADAWLRRLVRSADELLRA